MDDVTLVAAVQRGNEEALADLFEECHGWTYSTCLNALRDPDAAEEATARVFEVAVRSRLVGARTLRAAMIRLIYDACIEVEHELLRRESVGLGWLRRKGEQPPAAPDPKDLRLVAWRAAGDLTGPDRILFALAAAAELSTDAIATAVEPDKPAAIEKRLSVIRDHVVADVIAARSLDDCPDLRDTLRYAAKEPDHAARKKVHAHRAGKGKVPPCAKCTTTYDRWPLAALAALLPLTAVPAGLNDRLLDRMELALRAGLAAGTDRVRAVTGSYAVIDGATAEIVTPRRPPVSTPPPRPSAARPTSGRTTPGRPTPPHSQSTHHYASASHSESAPRPASAPHSQSAPRPASAPHSQSAPPSQSAPSSESSASADRLAGAGTATATATMPRPEPTAPASEAWDDDPTQVLPTAPPETAAAHASEAPGEPEAPASSAPAGDVNAADPNEASTEAPDDSGAGRGTRRYRPFATTATIAVTVLVLGAAGALALATHRTPTQTTESLAVGPTAPTLPDESPASDLTTPRPSPSTRVSGPSATSDREKPGARTSPSTSARSSIRPIAGSAKPKPSADPFRTFGTLTVVSPAYGSTVSLYDTEARLASVTLSVAVPTGFDAALLNSTLTWSGSYVRQQETHYADLGSGQDLTVDLQAAPRCTTAWTITATLTPPSGTPQYATTEVKITTC
ncbi:hypothetical protein [Cryptosporangium minutisporangium]|uniref:DNA-directed RNA polymerase specialized sigma24 family protein n=1 Tax=Cryptosporangium minutisporangium TaxID=113569 RepID=A0ABP6SQQ3_9ACTN